ncbi:MAG: hypothetical protein AB9856_06665 [Cellulosilyticaceae bacterium]
MCITVLDKLKYIKMKLNEDEESIVFADLNEGTDDKIFSNEPNLVEYQDFIKFCNGARCGSIDLWGLEDIPKNQFYIGQYTDIWICIGQILYEPIVINKKNGNVYLFDTSNSCVEYNKKFGSFNNFLNKFVLGNQYNEIIPDIKSDEWYIFLKKIEVV